MYKLIIDLVLKPACDFYGIITKFYMGLKIYSFIGLYYDI